MLPTLADFGIKSSVFIRKLDRRTHWHPSEGDNDLSLRARIASEKVFPPTEKRYSLWYVSTNEQFYGVLASLTFYANPKARDIDFICIEEDELQEFGITPELIPEGNCLHVKSLHFDVEICKNTAQYICYNLMNKGTADKRCQKAKVNLVLEHQRKLGCQSTETDCQSCQCETWE